MKTKLENKALEGTCNVTAAGGLLSWAGVILQALLFFAERGLNIGKGDSKERAARKEEF